MHSLTPLPDNLGVHALAIYTVILHSLYIGLPADCALETCTRHIDSDPPQCPGNST